MADGASTDRTLQALEACVQDDSRLRSTSTTHRGSADALTKALRAVRVTLIGWLNPFDQMSAGALARAVSALNAHSEWLLVKGKAMNKTKRQT